MPVEGILVPGDSGSGGPPRAAGRTKARVKKLGPKWKEISEVIFMVGPAVWHLSWLVTILFIQRDSKERRLVPGMLGPVNTS